MIKIASHLPVVVDPSHSAGRLDLVLPLSLAGVAAGADGVLVETHPNPEHALCDGPQSLPTAAFGEYAEPRPRPGALGRQDRRLSHGRRRRQAPSPSSASASWAARSGSPPASAPGSPRCAAISQTRATLELALERGAITHACGSLEEAAAGADLVFVCTPVRLVVEHVRRGARARRPRTPWSATSAAPRGRSCARLAPSEQRRCIGGHPLCGSETAGVANARASLYEGATYFVTPGAHVDADAYQLLYGFLGEHRRAPGRGRPRGARPADGASSATCRTCWPTCS